MDRIITQPIAEALHGMRLDQASVKLFPNYSRSILQRWIREGALRIDAVACKTCHRKLGTTDKVLTLQPKLNDPIAWKPIAGVLNVIYEDEHLLVLNKEANTVVHPGSGTGTTLANALLHRYPELEQLPRAGLVHRLDKDTTGLMMVAKTQAAQRALSQAIEQRMVRRIYYAVVTGITPTEGVIQLNIRRHPIHRTKMAPCLTGGRVAKTHYTRIETFRNHSLLQLSLHTGRTHQIRVHCSAIGHPIVGDPCYGLRKPSFHATEKDTIGRQALHASILSFSHPYTHAPMIHQAPLPKDMLQLIEILRESKNS